MTILALDAYEWGAILTLTLGIVSIALTIGREFLLEHFDKRRQLLRQLAKDPEANQPLASGSISHGTSSRISRTRLKV